MSRGHSNGRHRCKICPLSQKIPLHTCFKYRNEGRPGLKRNRPKLKMLFPRSFQRPTTITVWRRATITVTQVSSHTTFHTLPSSEYHLQSPHPSKTILRSVLMTFVTPFPSLLYLFQNAMTLTSRKCSMLRFFQKQ